MAQERAQHIIYVEDKADQRETFLAQMAIARLRNPVTLLTSVQDMRRYLANTESPVIDILLVDWLLMDGTGRDIIELVQADSRGTWAAIVVTSAAGETVHEAESARAHAFVEKPLSLPAIDAALRQINGFGYMIVRPEKE